MEACSRFIPGGSSCAALSYGEHLRAVLQTAGPLLKFINPGSRCTTADPASRKPWALAAVGVLACAICTAAVSWYTSINRLSAASDSARRLFAICHDCLSFEPVVLGGFALHRSAGVEMPCVEFKQPEQQVRFWTRSG